MQFIDLKKQQNQIRDKINKRISKVLDHGKYIMGPEINELESHLAKFTNVKHCISCSSGTDALLIPLMAEGIGPGDAVITTPFTYIATAEVIKFVGATPVFVDIEPDTFNIDAYKIRNSIKIAKAKGLKVKAIIPVDLFGLPANYNQIYDNCSNEDLFIIEDAAQGFGGMINEKKAGSFGTVGATSFFPAKPLGCYGDGGAIFTDDDNLFEVMKSIRVHGGGFDKYDNVRLGLNGRLDTIQATILLEKLSLFPVEIELRNKVAKYYSDNIPNYLNKPSVPEGFKSVWAQYSLLSESKEQRDFLISYLKRKEIPAMIYYRIPLHLQKVFSDLGYSKGDFPISEDIADRVFSIPMHPYLEKNDQDKIIEALISFEK